MQNEVLQEPAETKEDQSPTVCSAEKRRRQGLLIQFLSKKVSMNVYMINAFKMLLVDTREKSCLCANTCI